MYQDVIYKFADQREILRLGALYQTVFNRSLGPEELQWRYIENPLLGKQLYNYIAVGSTGGIVGHSAFIPMRYLFNHTQIKGALSVGSMVRRDYSGIFPKILQALEDQLYADKFDFLFAFPNEKSYSFFKYFGYKDHQFSHLQLDKKKAVHVTESILSEQLLIGVKNALDENFLKWRIQNCPINRYVILDSQNYEIGYKFYNETEVDLIWVSCQGHYLNTQDFLDIILKKINAQRYNIYCTDHRFHDVLTSIGFKRHEVQNKFIYKVINPALHVDTFSMQMIDSDIF